MLAWLMNMGFAASGSGTPSGVTDRLVGFIRNLGTLMTRR